MGEIGEIKEFILDTLVTTEWLSEHLSDTDLVVLHCAVGMEHDSQGGVRPASGRPEYNAGHIPDASNLDALFLVDESGRYKSLEELATMHDGDRHVRAITYCGGGVAASSNAFVMTRLGFTNVAVYAASLQEWTADPDNLLVEGSA